MIAIFASDMNYTRLNTTEHPLFEQAWELYKKSFPPEERRQLRTQRKIMNHPQYRFDVITDNNHLTGILLWWRFDELRFIEHIATSPCIRGKGYGRQILQQFIEETATTPVVLEVERPTTEINKRRIAFYQRLGFVYNDYPYQQPPYKKGGSFIPMALMTCPDAITKNEVNLFCEKYHPVIYKFAFGLDF